jgi:hypothetical protein
MKPSSSSSFLVDGEGELEDDDGGGVVHVMRGLDKIKNLVAYYRENPHLNMGDILTEAVIEADLSDSDREIALGLVQRLIEEQDTAVVGRSVRHNKKEVELESDDDGEEGRGRNRKKKKRSRDLQSDDEEEEEERDPSSSSSKKKRVQVQESRKRPHPEDDGGGDDEPGDGDREEEGGESNPHPPRQQGRLKRLRTRQKRAMMELAQALDEAKKAQEIKPFDTRLEEQLKTSRMGKLAAGHAIYHSIRKMLDKLDTDTWYRTKDQRIVQNRVCAGTAPLVYGELLQSHEREIKLWNGFETVRSEILLTMPRRAGKTQAIVMVLSILLLTVPNIDMVLIAPSSRAAGVDTGFMGHIRRFITTRFPETKFEKTNKEILEIKHSDGDTRKFKAYPGGATHK